MTTAMVSWPAMVAAVTPPAPSVRTVTSTLATYAAPGRPPTRAHQGTLPSGACEQELVVDGQDELGAQALGRQGRVTADHGQLDDVGGRALNHGVHGQALTQRADLPVAGSELRDLPAASPQGADVSR